MYKPFIPKNKRIKIHHQFNNLFLNAIKTSNVGDLMSSPFNYFHFPGNCFHRDFWSTVNASIEPNRFKTIVVGGGVFSNNFVKDKIYFERLNCQHLILWGVGTSRKIQERNIHPELYNKATIISTRDYLSADIDNKKVFYCPCASAMSTLFDVQLDEVSHRAVSFLHYQKDLDKTKFVASLPTLHNYTSFFDAIKFLNSAEVVITNSYHGMYWATLLGKRVISLVASGKFSQFKWAPTFSNMQGIENLVNNYPSLPFYSSSLREARMFNINFYQKVIPYFLG